MLFLARLTTSARWCYQYAHTRRIVEWLKGRSFMFGEDNSKEFDIREATDPLKTEVERIDDNTNGLITEWEPICIGDHDIRIEDVSDLIKPSAEIVFGGSIQDIKSLRQTIRILDDLKAQEIRPFMAWTITSVFVVWTILGLISFFTTGSTWLLITDAGPAAIFGVIVNYYFRNSKEGY